MADEQDGTYINVHISGPHKVGKTALANMIRVLLAHHGIGCVTRGADGALAGTGDVFLLGSVVARSCDGVVITEEATAAAPHGAG